MRDRLLIVALLLSRVAALVARNRDAFGAVQFRISETELSKVSRAFLLSKSAYITYREENSISGEVEDVRYSLKNAQIAGGDPAAVNVTLPSDDHIRATTKFQDMNISGKLVIMNSRETGETDLDVQLNSVTLVAEGQVNTDSVDVVNGVHGVKEVILSVPSCHVETLFFGKTRLTQTGITDTNLQDIIKDVICQMFHVKFALGFDEANVDMKLGLFNMRMSSRAVSLQIKNSTVIVTQVLQTSDGREPPSYADIDDVTYRFPPLREHSLPFEMWLNQDIVSDMWRVYKKERKIGEMPIPLNVLLPLVPYSNISTGSIPFITQIAATFPNATADVFVQDADVSLGVTDTSLQININITGRLAVTLNCDRNITLPAFDFNMFAYVPTQVGSNNKAVISHYSGIGGHVTILSSNIGHVASRWLHVTLNALPQILGPDVFAATNAKVGGLSIDKLLPVGLYIRDSSIALAKDNLIIGGRLCDEDPKLSIKPRGKIEWVGDISLVSDLIFRLYDETPDDLIPLPEQNCVAPTTSGSTSAAVELTALQLTLYIAVYCAFVPFIL